MSLSTFTQAKLFFSINTPFIAFLWTSMGNLTRIYQGGVLKHNTKYHTGGGRGLKWFKNLTPIFEWPLLW